MLPKRLRQDIAGIVKSKIKVILEDKHDGDLWLVFYVSALS